MIVEPTAGRQPAQALGGRCSEAVGSTQVHKVRARQPPCTFSGSAGPLSPVVVRVARTRVDGRANNHWTPTRVDGTMIDMTNDKQPRPRGTHNGPPTCVHGKSMKRDTCQECIERRSP